MIPPLDVRTLIAVNAAVYASLTLALLFFWRQTQAPGLGRLALAHGLTVVGASLVALQGGVPDLLSLVVGQTVLVAAAAVLLDGEERFFGLGAPPARRTVLIVAFAAVALFVFVYLLPSERARALLFSALVAALFGRAAWVAARRGRALGDGPASRLRAASLGSLCGVLVLRFVLTAAGASFAGVVVLVLFVVALGGIGGTLGIVAAINRRLIRAHAASQQALAESDKRYRELFERGFGLVCTHDLDGKLLSINPAAAAALGRPPEELVGGNLAEVLTDKARSLLPGYLERLRREGHHEGQMAVRTRAGDRRLWSYRNRVIATAGQPPIVLGHATDVTDLQRAQRALAEREKRYRELFERNFGLVATHTTEGAILSINPAGADLLGYEVEDLVGGSLYELMPEAARARFTESLAAVVAGGSGEGLLTLSTRAGEERTLIARSHFVAEAETPYVLVNAMDLTERLRAERVLEHQALHDPLTGCANRLLFDDRLAQALAEAARDGRGQDPHPVALFYVDLDDLKSVNDAHGHAAGDAVLREAASRLRRSVRQVDTVARLAGDEFALILPRSGTRADAERLADELVELLARSFPFQERSLTTQASVGLAFFPEHGRTPEELLARADQAMYRAKQEGRGRYRVA